MILSLPAFVEVASLSLAGNVGSNPTAAILTISPPYSPFTLLSLSASLFPPSFPHTFSYAFLSSFSSTFSPLFKFKKRNRFDKRKLSGRKRGGWWLTRRRIEVSLNPYPSIASYLTMKDLTSVTELREFDAECIPARMFWIRLSL